VKLPSFRKECGKGRRVRQKEVLRHATDAILENKMYLNPDLQFNTVVRAAGTNRTYLWDAIRARGLNFKSYIARFRLLYFIEHAWTDEFRNLSYDDIAERCGFSCRKMLDRYLQKVLGITLPRYMEIIRRL